MYLRTQRASAVVEMPIVHSGADHLPQASRTQGHDQPVYFPSGPLQRVPGAAAVAVDPTATAAVVAATNSTRTGPRPTTLALSPNSQEVKRKERDRKRESRAKRKREEAAVAQAQAAEKATKTALRVKKLSQKSFATKRKNKAV